MKNFFCRKIELSKLATTDIVLYTFIALISVLIILRDVRGVSISKYVFVALATLVFVVRSKSDMYCLLAFIAPLTSGISATYISIVAVIVMLLKRWKCKYLTVGVFAMFVICILELLSVSQGDFVIDNYIRFVGVFLITFLRMIDVDESYDNPKMLNLFLFGTVTALISIWGQMLNQYSFGDIFAMGSSGLRVGNVRQLLDLTEEGMLVSYNPNGLGSLCCIAAIFSLLMQKKSGYSLYYLLFLIFSLQGFITLSRAFLITYVVAIVAYFLLTRRNSKFDIKQYVIGFAICGVLLFLFNEYFEIFIDAFMKRFGADDVSGGRLYLLSYYFDEWSNSIWRILFGAGLQNYAAKYDTTSSAHNAIQEILLTWGISGLITVIVLFVTIIKGAKVKNREIRLYQYIPLCIFLLFLMSGQGFSLSHNMAKIMVAYSAIMLEFYDDI